jgi:hypothetical protein
MSLICLAFFFRQKVTKSPSFENKISYFKIVYISHFSHEKNWATTPVWDSGPTRQPVPFLLLWHKSWDLVLVLYLACLM